MFRRSAILSNNGYDSPIHPEIFFPLRAHQTTPRAGGAGRPSPAGSCGMTSLWNRLLGRSEILRSRPWDLTEIVPLSERLWFRLLLIALGILLLAAVFLML